MTQFLAGARYFPLLQNVSTNSGAHLSQCSVSTWAFCPGCEADHSSTCSAGVKNEWSYIAVLQHAFMTSAETSLVLSYLYSTGAEAVL